MPHLNYGILAWGYQPGRLVTLQKKAVRAITFSAYNAHTSPIFKNLRPIKKYMISTHFSSWNSTIKWCIQTCQFILIHYLLSEIKTSMATIHDAEIKLVQSELNMNLLKDVSDIV